MPATLRDLRADHLIAKSFPSAHLHIHRLKQIWGNYAGRSDALQQKHLARSVATFGTDSTSPRWSLLWYTWRGEVFETLWNSFTQLPTGGEQYHQATNHRARHRQHVSPHVFCSLPQRVCSVMRGVIKQWDVNGRFSASPWKWSGGGHRRAISLPIKRLSPYRRTWNATCTSWWMRQANSKSKERMIWRLVMK